MTAQNSAVRSAQSGPFTTKSKTLLVSPAAVPAANTLDVVIAFVGAKVGDVASVQMLAALDGGVLAGPAQCLVADQVTWRLANPTAAPITPTPLNCKVTVGTVH
jgi:hypothetical protein